MERFLYWFWFTVVVLVVTWFVFYTTVQLELNAALAINVVFGLCIGWLGGQFVRFSIAIWRDFKESYNRDQARREKGCKLFGHDWYYFQDSDVRSCARCFIIEAIKERTNGS